MTQDYKPTVFLPKTAFPMKAGLPQKEPELLAFWDRIGLFERLREQSKGREKFVLHDGPPYANGNLHIGHALNKILKDVVTRSQQMLGKDSHYVPGWDCHGLPIEWKIEEAYRAKKNDKDDVPVVEFRRECRAFAEQWVGIQREEFKRLGVIGDWANPYTTMSYPAEAAIVRELGKFLMNGGLQGGAVVGGREDRAGRGRDRVSRPRLGHDPRALPDREGADAQARRRGDRDLDHDALDHPR
jgi:isoleucyl-tRNA synthetase